jgi:hypothetical protein
MPTPAQVVDPITIANYSKMEWQNTVNHYPTAKNFMKKGNINRDVGGTQLSWPIEAGMDENHVVQDYEDVADLYTMTTNYARASIDWGLIGSFKAISKGQLRTNSGNEALVKFGRKTVPSMFKNLLNQNTGSLFWHFFNTNLYSYVSTNNKVPFAGLPSVFTGTTAITWSSASKQGTINNTNYAGLTCVSGGLTSVTIPRDDAWTPQAFNTTSGAYGNSSAPTFALNAFAILSDAISACSKFDANDPTKQTQEVVLTRSLYVDFATLMQQKQSFLLTGKVSKGAAFGIGMDVMAGLEHNGVPVRWDGHVPASTGYLLNYDQMFLDLQPRYEFSKDSNSALTTSGDDDGIFETEVRYNDGRMAVTVSATCPGQFRINPRYQGMLYAGA